MKVNSHFVALPAIVAALVLAGCSSTATPVSDGANTIENVRTVDTLLGEVTVPAEIDSIVVLEGRRDLDIVLSLGLPLTGYPYEEPGSVDLDSPVAEELAAAKESGAKELFLADDISLEAIASAEPDLIISRVDDVEPLQQELESIAPVLAIGDQSKSTWQDDLRLVAAATGTEARAEELISQYDEEVTKLSQEYADMLTQNSFVPMSYNGESLETRPNRLLSLTLRDLGATPSKAFQEAIDGEEIEYSPEQTLSGFQDADGIIALVNDPHVWEEFSNDPLFQQLPAVENGHVIRSDKQTHEGGALTAMHALQVIEDLLESF